jgi:hypothetical protein
MYLVLFRAITDSLGESDIEKIKIILQKAQIEAEEICINSDEEI